MKFPFFRKGNFIVFSELKKKKWKHFLSLLIERERERERRTEKH